MTPDPYENVRGAFHTVAGGLMGWQDPPQPSPYCPDCGGLKTEHDPGCARKRAESRSNGLPTGYLTARIPELEQAAESLTRLGDIQSALPLWKLALMIRQEVRND